MKRTIKGKTYNTDTAKELIEVTQNYESNLYYTQETLYQKRNGEFFVHASGGPGTIYAEQMEENHYVGGETIMPLTNDDAKKWVEKYCTSYDYNIWVTIRFNSKDAKKYEKIFGRIEE